VGRVFLLEDDALVRLMIAGMLKQLGHRIVAEAESVKNAQFFAQNPECDFAILDINVGGQSSIPIGEMLHERGVPFLFSSGYVSEFLRKRFGRCPLLREPFTIEQRGY
jgi:DNA-binding NarL/FixJ family response regulator